MTRLTRVVSSKLLLKSWEESAMLDGYTLHATAIDAEPVPGGYLPAFTGHDGICIIVEKAAPLPTAMAARNSLRNTLWGAHADEHSAINLEQHPDERAAQQAAA